MGKDPAARRPRRARPGRDLPARRPLDRADAGLQVALLARELMQPEQHAAQLRRAGQAFEASRWLPGGVVGRGEEVGCAASFPTITSDVRRTASR